MEIVLLTDIAETLSLENKKIFVKGNPLCSYIVSSGACVGISCNVCPFDMNESKLNLTQYKLDKLKG